MITREEFTGIIDKLEKATKLQNDIHKFVRNNNDITDGVDCGIVICHEQVVIDLLDHIFNQDKKESWISYFIYEGEYGKALQHDSVIEKDGTPIDITNAEKLYDFLVGEMSDTKGKSDTRFSDVKEGEMFCFAGFDWIRLKDGIAITKDFIKTRNFDKGGNDWRESELREYLNCVFYKILMKNGAEEKDFLLIETDLTADDGMKDYGTSKDLISLMTSDLYRSNRHLLKPLESWWLATPHSCLASYSYYMRCVYSSGTLGYSYAYNVDCGVRPIIKLSPNTQVKLGEKKEV